MAKGDSVRIVVGIVKRNLWGYITLAEENPARHWLNQPRSSQSAPAGWEGNAKVIKTILAGIPLTKTYSTNREYHELLAPQIT